MIEAGLRYLAVICLLAFLTTCSGGRAVRESSAPQADWVRSRPVSPGNYIGIGWAQKTSDIHQYQQAAKQNALADLASEISVNISSSSVLHTFESKLGFREDFSSTIQASTREELEGFQLVDTWEDQGNYWIYYRLSAARHNEIKERRKNDAVALSAGLLANSLENRDQGNIRLSIVQMVNSLEAIRHYFNDPLPAELNGRNIQLGVEIFNELSSSFSRLRISPVRNEITVKNGQAIQPSLLEFRVISELTGPVTDFPLIASYSERPIRNNRARTGHDGVARFSVESVRSAKNFESFVVRADMETILAEATTDPVIRRLVGRFPVPETVTRIFIQKPVIRLDAREEIMGKAIQRGSLEEGFRKNALDGGYKLTMSQDDADYTVRIRANAMPSGETGNMRNMVLQGSITIETANGRLIYQRNLDGFRGSHLNADRAAEEAYRQAVNRLNSSFFREMDDVLKSGINTSGN
jgi:hypothetical protein